MKNLKYTLLAAVVLGCAGAARADLYSVTASASTSPSSPFYRGQSGVTTFTFTMNGAPGDHTTTWSADNVLLGDYSDFSADPTVFSSATIDGSSTLIPHATAGGTYVEGTAYTVIVDWTISATATLNHTTLNALTFAFDVNTPPGDPSSGEKSPNQSLPFRVVPTPVPEPAQAVASLALLGCGGLVFIGRRFIKKQA